MFNWPLIRSLPQKTDFRFVGFARIAGVLSILAVAASLFFTAYPFKGPCGGLNCGVDFKGGTVMEINTGSTPADLGRIRATLSALNYKDVQVQQLGTPSSALVRFIEPTGMTAADSVTRAKAELPKAVPGLTVKRSESVSGKVSGELFGKGILALFLAIGLMLVYIWFRFGLTFGIGAVAALFHDVFLTFGLFAFTHLEFTLTSVAAILTIIGYSMNDTVVVLDRIRENLRKYKRMPLREIIDLSINETLSRTIITGLTGVLALSGLAIFGGEAMFTFSIAMIFGIVIGTYSSIYIAAPIMLLLGVRRGEPEAEIVGPATAGNAVPRP